MNPSTMDSNNYQVFIKLLNGKHKSFNFTTPLIPLSNLKHRIQTLTSIPTHHQILTPSNRIKHNNNNNNNNNDFIIHHDNSFPLFFNLSLRLRGGKGGFGSLLRSTKAGQKKTNNFDACRDMSGRRLRHVNAEKKLEEWRADAEERKLEKVAEEFLKKNAKKVAKSGKRNGNDSSEKYVAKYRETSAKCMEDVEKSVRESFKADMEGGKRKGKEQGNSHNETKRLKIWLGKRAVNESDSDDSEGEIEEREDEKSVIIDNGSHSDSSKEAPVSACCMENDESRDQGGSSESSPEEEVTVAEKPLVASEDEDIVDKIASVDNLEENPDNSGIEKEVDQLPGDSPSKLDVAPCAEMSHQPEAILESTGVEAVDLDKPLNFDEYNSAAELEVLGLERLKTELQSRGLKCGGTLPERAGRLFLLKTTPLDMLPKKLFAKK